MSDVNMEKKKKLSDLTQGDIIQLVDGQECKFVRLKRTRFIGIIDGEGYDIPVGHFKYVLEKNDKDVDSEIKELENGDLFYYKNKNGKAILLRFKEVDKEYIIGINPISKSKVKLPKNMYTGSIKELQ